MNDTLKSPTDTLSLLKEIVVRLLRDTASRCGLSGSETKKDIKYFLSRVDSEGIGFLTKKLPYLAKGLDSIMAFNTGTLGRDHEFWRQGGFSTKLVKLTESQCLIPEFMCGYFRLFFVMLHHGDGPGLTVQRFRDESLAVEAVRAIRQVSYLAYKLEMPFTQEQKDDAVAKFIAIDRSLPARGDSNPLSSETACAVESARILLLRVLQGFDPADIIPAHGPGAVATGEKPWQKMKFARYYKQLDDMYPYSDYMYYNYTHLVDNLEDSDLEDPSLEEPLAKLALVPKDSRGPRVISMEPLEFQWIQQGVGRALMKYLERDTSLCSGYVNFTSQEINRDLARLASIRNTSASRLCTLDMQDASDRVSTWLVERLYPYHVFKYLYACRSTGTLLPNGDRFELRKFAPMGSALCFPIEALTFWALAVGSLRRIRRFSDCVNLPAVYVYGDDIIASIDDYERIQPVFDELHLKFNADKCCLGSIFKESCGFDALLGNNVSPTRIKHHWTDPMPPTAALSYVTYVNALRDKGYTLTSNYLEEQCIKAFGPVPVTREKGKHQFAFVHTDWTIDQVIGYNLANFRRRHNKRWQRDEIRVPVPGPRVFKRGKPDWEEMLRRHSNWGTSCPFGTDAGLLPPCSHTVPHSVKLRGAWQDVLDF